MIIGAIVGVYTIMARWRIEDSIRRRDLPPLVIPLLAASTRERPSHWTEPADHWSPPVDDHASVSSGDEMLSETAAAPATATTTVQPSDFAPPQPAAANGLHAEESWEQEFARPRTSVPTQPSRATDTERSMPVVAGADGVPMPSSLETVRFIRPGDESVQLLPGRLEVLAGEPRHREIRFVRVPGERPHLILGREAGQSPQQVALESSTVSRRHARFAYDDGRWGVVNLSQTNPVVVNDEVLSANDAPRPLTDGDRIELGDVVLRFRAH